MMKEVEIACDDQGQYTVGMPPAGEDQGEGAATGPMAQVDSSYMKPVANLEAALQVARDMLSGTTGDQAQAAENDFQQGFNRSSPMGLRKAG